MPLSMDNWAYNPTHRSDFTSFITARCPPCMFLMRFFHYIGPFFPKKTHPPGLFLRCLTTGHLEATWGEMARFEPLEARPQHKRVKEVNEFRLGAFSPGPIWKNMRTSNWVQFLQVGMNRTSKNIWVATTQSFLLIHSSANFWWFCLALLQWLHTKARSNCWRKNAWRRRLDM